MDIFADIFVGALSLWVVLYPLISGKPLRYRPARSSIPWRTVDPIGHNKSCKCCSFPHLFGAGLTFSFD
jgi:hypothetical protein